MPTPAQDRLAPENVRLILSAWMDRHNLDSFPWLTDPKMVEVGVCAPLFDTEDEDDCICGHQRDNHELGKGKDGNCGLCSCPRFVRTIYHVGKLDLLGRLRSDPKQLCPVDHKTTGKIDGRFIQQFTMDSQMTGYIYDANYLGFTKGEIGQLRYDVTTCFINAIELGVVPTSTRKCSTHGVPYAECGPEEHIKYQVIGPIERTTQQIEQWRETAVFLAKQFHKLSGLNVRDMRDVRQQGTFNGSCGFCEFREWCLTDRAPKQVDKMFTAQPWSPVAHVFGPGGLKKADPLGLYLDNSTLAATARCNTQALMRYGMGWSNAEQTGPLAAGTAAHLALETWFKGGTSQQALKAFEESYGNQE